MTVDADTNEAEQLRGACDVLEILREEFAQWTDEGQDESQREALESVLAHIESMEDEYRRRLATAEAE
ncbi:MAG: hypothetical protein KDA73_05155 [Rhodobacteraceae bacterium]|nr:hypothetical protein [Paracoccaceae bacterium]